MTPRRRSRGSMAACEVLFGVRWPQNFCGQRVAEIPKEFGVRDKNRVYGARYVSTFLAKSLKLLALRCSDFPMENLGL